MTSRATEAGDPAHAEHRTLLSRGINLLGAAVVLGYLVAAAVRGSVDLPALILPLALLSAAAWIASVLVPARMQRTMRVLLLLAIAAGACAAWGTSGLMIVPVIAGLLQLAARDEHQWIGIAAAAVAGGLIALGAIVAAGSEDGRVTVPSVLALEGAVLVALLGGSNRRQGRARDAAAHEALVQAAAAREEQARADALAMRQGLARDMHDVLAHSLGGLVIQLDAAEAQLEAGQSSAALTRVRDAREMAAAGLAEARRAVDALRAAPSDAPAEPVSGAELNTAVRELVDAHERLGGSVEFAERGGSPARPLAAPRPLSAEAAAALRRAAQESLSNARKHAPGAPVSMELAWEADRVTLTVRNPVRGAGSTALSPASPTAAALASSGSGRGLAGMRERFAELPGATAEYGEHDGVFEVRVSAPLAPSPETGGEEQR